MNQKFDFKGQIQNNKSYLEIIEIFIKGNILSQKEISQIPISILHLFLLLHHAFPSALAPQGPVFLYPSFTMKKLHSSFLCHIHVSMYFLVCCRRLQQNYFQFSLFLSHSPCISMQYLLRHKIYTCIVWRDIVCMCVCAHTIALLLYICFGSFLLILSDVVSSSEKSQ